MGVMLKFADGEYLFHFDFDGLIEVEHQWSVKHQDASWRPKSIMQLYGVLSRCLSIGSDGAVAFHWAGVVVLPQIIQVICLGLMGGCKGIVDGKRVFLSPERIENLIASYVYPARPMAESAALAFAILHHVLFGNLEIRKAA